MTKSMDIDLFCSLLGEAKTFPVLSSSLGQSRWLTTGNRGMIVYCSKHGLRGEKVKVLTTLVTFIVTIYYKMWFEIKCAPLMIDGPRHLLKTVQLLSSASAEGEHIMVTVKISFFHFCAVTQRRTGLLLLRRLLN